jgi:hypothetical protein
MNESKIIIVSGALANKCLNGGAAWTRLSWTLGLKKLGFEVYFIEQIRRANCVDGAGRATCFSDSTNLAYFRKVTEQFGLAPTAALICEEGDEIYGPGLSQLREIAAASELLVNLSGNLRLPALRKLMRRSVYVDLDPGFTQFWHAMGTPDIGLAGHEHYFTVGENIGASSCPIPTSGIDWHPVRQPVLLDEWTVTQNDPGNRFTTVGSWRGPYGPVLYQGQVLGPKVHEFRKLLDLPLQSPHTFELALDIDAADRRDLNSLESRGWRIVDPRRVVPDPESFRRYVRESSAEFSAAQAMYVKTNSGWVSDRTIRYLASGKPALVQDTGFSRNYPVGEGWVPFQGLEDAVAGAEQIMGNYTFHSRAARMIAEEYFGSDTVLSSFVRQVGVSL